MTVTERADGERKKRLGYYRGFDEPGVAIARYLRRRHLFIPEVGRVCAAVGDGGVGGGRVRGSHVP
jgi:hypothetical protein